MEGKSKQRSSPPASPRLKKRNLLSNAASLSPPSIPRIHSTSKPSYVQHTNNATHLGPRRRRQRSSVSGPKLWIALSTVCAMILWTMSLLWISLSMEDYHNRNRKPSWLRPSSSSSRSLQNSNNDYPDNNNLNNDTLPQVLPRYEMQLWPDDRASDSSKWFSFLTNYHHRPDKNQNGSENDTEPLHVLLVQPPGVFGSLIQEFVQTLVLSHNATVHSFSHLPPASEQYGERVKVVRTVTSPLLLEAVDVALSIQAQHNTSLQSWQDLETMVRILVQWQHRVNDWMDHNHLSATLVTIQSTLLIPQQNEERLTRFLFGTRDTAERKENDETHVVPRDNLAQRALHRIDTCTQFLMQLSNVPPNPHEVVQSWMQQEMEQHRHNKEPPILLQEGTVAERVQALLFDGGLLDARLAQ